VNLKIEAARLQHGFPPLVGRDETARVDPFRERIGAG